MAFLISLLCGLITNAGYDAFQSMLPFEHSDHNVYNAIKQAYERALNNWTANNGIKDSFDYKQNDYLTDVLNQLRGGDCNTNEIELLKLFRKELEADNRTLGFLNYQLNKETYKKINIISDQSILKPLPSVDYANNYFVTDLKHNKFYIPRTVKYQLSNDDVWLNHECVLEELLTNHKNIVVLGSAGLGKSTELQQLALNIADNCCPLDFQLNSYLSTKPLEQTLSAGWLANKNHKVLILDGLDEVMPTDTELVKREIAQFTKTHSDIPVIVSCRSNFYTDTREKGGAMGDFTIAYLQPLTINSAVKYIAERYPNANKNEFIEQIHSKGLLTLLENPFWTIAMVEYYNEKGSLGENVSDLFNYLIDRNFSRDTSHYSGSISMGRRRSELHKSLKLIAFCMNATSKRILTMSELVELLDNDDALELVKCSGTFGVAPTTNNGTNEVWQFKHGYFQEFLTAQVLKSFTCEKIRKVVESASGTLLPGWQNTGIPN